MAFNPDQPRDKNGRWSAVGAYISEDGFAMNEICRTGDIDSDSRIAQLDNIIGEQATQYEGTVYRGMDNSFSEYIEINKGIRFESDNDYTDVLDGFEFSDPAFVSTTMDKNIAIDFANRGNGIGVLLEVESTKKSLNVSDVMGEDVNWQEERIFPRDTSFIVKSARTETIQDRDILILSVIAR